MCGKNQDRIQCHTVANRHLHMTVLKPQLHADLPRSLWNKQREYTNYSGGGEEGKCTSFLVKRETDLVVKCRQQSRKP